MIVENQPMADYLAHKGIGSSQLKTILESPKDYLYSLKKPSKETSSTSKGTLWHSFMLERQLYLDEHMIQPEDWGPLTQNPGRKLWAEFKEKAKEAGKKPVKFSDAGDLLDLEKEMLQHEEFKKIMHNHKAEVSFYAEIDGIKLKSREDIWCHEDGSVWDVKTTSQDMDDESLEKAIFYYGYHFSAAHHMNVMKAAGAEVYKWGWIFVSTGTPAPHIVIKQASPDLLAAGMNDWNHAFNLLKECTASNRWPGYSDEIEEIGLPDWVERKYY